MNKSSSILFFSILSILTLPSFFYVALSQSSLTVGILIAIFFSILFNFKLIVKKVTTKTVFIYMYLFLLHYLIIIFIHFNTVDSKYFLSFFILMIFFIASLLLYTKIISMNKDHFTFTIKYLSYIMISFGILSLLVKIDFFNYNNYSKSIFPYAEPSHFVLAISPFLIFLGLVHNTFIRLLLVVLVFLLAISYKSLLLMALSLMMSFIYYSNNLKKIMILLLSVSFIFLFIFDNNKYFSDRVDFSNENRNLTVLVYKQGLEESYNNLFNTYGIGVGFQRLGQTPPLNISELIFSLAGEYKNRNDGGFLASKVIGEFGILGLSVVLLYIFQFINSFIFISRTLKSKLIIDPKLLFAHSIVLGFFIEMFGRGYGYFSPGVILIFVAVLILQFYKIKNLRNDYCG